MTSLRFTGDLPLWLGLLLATLVGLLSWRYYNRESFDLPRRLRWLLPLLRSGAFFLGVLLLTGPVLHHRATIGELGRVQIYVDASQSMTMQDRHLPLGRKIAIVEQLGWISPETIDTSSLQLAEQLAEARRLFASALANTESDDPEDPPTAVAKLLTDLNSIQSSLPPSVSGQFLSELISPLKVLTQQPEPEKEQLLAVVTAAEEFEATLVADFESSIESRLAAGEQSIQSALTMFDEASRSRRAILSLADSPANLLKQLQERHEVAVFELNGAAVSPLRLIPSDASEAPASDVPSFSKVTDLSSGIMTNQGGNDYSASSKDVVVQPNSAIVLLTDGQHNSGPSPLQAARLLGGQGTAFYCVAFGPMQSAPDLAVTSIEHPELVFAKDRIRGMMTIKDSVPPGTPFVAQVSHGDEILWQRELVTENTPERKIDFEFGIEELVEKLGSQFETQTKRNLLPLELSASLSQLPQESESQNNQRAMRLAAILQGDKVLILDGRPRWETRYLRNAFERDEQWQVNTIIVGPRTEEMALPRGESDGQFPPDRDALFEYDLVIFGEVPPTLFSEHELRWLREFVEIRGGGMVFIDGHRGTLRELPEETLAGLIPVEWLPESLASKPQSLRLTERGATETALRLIPDDQQNRRFWTELPAPHTIVGASALPDTETLVEVQRNGQSMPAIVTRQFGAGRVLYFSFDETWRWRYKSADVWHQRFWNQIAKFVMPKPFAISDDFVSIDTGSVSYSAGETVDVRVRILGLDGRPTSEASADALFWKDSELAATVALSPDPNVPGVYYGRSAPLPEGEYEVSIRAAGYTDSALKARSEFVVLAPETGEMVDTAINESLLQQMAGVSGGVALREEEIGQLAELLSPLSSGRIVETETPIWQSYWWFGVMILLLTIEWILRKRAGLL